MKQNNYFSLKRFIRLLQNDFLLNRKIYLFSVIGLGIAIYAITYILFINSSNSSFRHQDYIPLLLIYLMVVGVFIGTSFPALTDQIKKTNYLLAPGSLFEKYMVQFVTRIVIFIPLALSIFWIGVHLAKTTVILFPIWNTNYSGIEDYHFFDLFRNQNLRMVDIMAIFLSIFSMASLLFAGCTYFNRFALVKTLIVTTVTVFTIICSMVLFSHLFYPAETNGFDIRLKTYKIGYDLYNTQLAIYLLGGLSWLFFLPLTYFKLKEKEV